jgi:hypothetical protein
VNGIPGKSKCRRGTFFSHCRIQLALALRPALPNAFYRTVGIGSALIAESREAAGRFSHTSKTIRHCTPKTYEHNTPFYAAGNICVSSATYSTCPANREFYTMYQVISGFQNDVVLMLALLWDDCRRLRHSFCVHLYDGELWQSLGFEDNIYRVFQKEFYTSETLYRIIQRTCTVF